MLQPPFLSHLSSVLSFQLLSLSTVQFLLVFSGLNCILDFSLVSLVSLFLFCLKLSINIIKALRSLRFTSVLFVRTQKRWFESIHQHRWCKNSTVWFPQTQKTEASPAQMTLSWESESQKLKSEQQADDHDGSLHINIYSSRTRFRLIHKNQINENVDWICSFLRTMTQLFIYKFVWSESSLIQRKMSHLAVEPEPGASNIKHWRDFCLVLPCFDFTKQSQTLDDAKWKVPAPELCISFTPVLHQLVIQVRSFSTLMLITMSN